MLRRILIASAAAAMLLVTFTPDDADARGRGGGGYRGGGGGYGGGAVAVRGARGGAVAVRGGRYGYRGGALSRLRCRCGGGRGRCGRSRCGRGLPRQLPRRLRQLRLRRRVPSVLSGAMPLASTIRLHFDRGAVSANAAIDQPPRTQDAHFAECDLLRVGRHDLHCTSGRCA